MESIGVLAAEGTEWNSFNGVLSNGEADFMVQLLGTHSFSSEEDEYPSLLENISSTYFPNHELTNNTNEMTSFDENSYFCSNIVNPSFQTFSQESSYSNGNNVDNPYMQTLSHENYYLNNYITPMMNDGSSLSMDYLIVPDEGNIGLAAKVFPEDVIEEAHNTYSNEEMKNESFIETSSFEPHDDHVVLHQDHKFQPKRKSPHEMTNPDSSIEEKHIESPKKKTRVTEAVGKKKRVVQSKKKPKQSSTNSTNNDDEDRQSSSSENSSGEESNNSQEQNEDPNSSSKVTLNSNGKTRASRGSATDPQSLYARKRREKINERLRILQNLVPNGTKVDISTMLEEAVEYVKFLQLQIKLLSSDDLWMYSPIAYNGMNIDALDHMKMNISSMQRH